MSTQPISPEHVCYVHCNFCNTVLAVNVPGNNLFNNNIVTVRCGHCANLLSVNLGALVQTPPIPNLQIQASQDGHGECSSSSNCNRASVAYSSENVQLHMLPQRPPEKRQRVPSAYNRFIKEEIQRIKANNPEISHREAFSAAAKNWAHFPHIHFGLTLDGSKQPNLDEPIPAQAGAQKSQGFY